MDPEFSEYYRRGLHYMHASFRQFANEHPKIARRLGAQADEVGDPYVERLLQSFAATEAQSQMRIDRMSEAFTLRLLQCVNPNYVTPLPSMAVARFFPDPEAVHSPRGQTLLRGTKLSSHEAGDGRTPCLFLSSQDVTLRPLTICSVRATGIPADIPSLHRYLEQQDISQVRGALRLRLATINGTPLCSLEGLDRLPVYLCGAERMASHLFELIHTSVVGMVMGVPRQFATGELYGAKVFGKPKMGVEYEGLEPDQSLLRPVSPRLHGHMLVHEFFACPHRFWFFALTGLAAGLAKIDGPEVEIVLLLSREVAAIDQQIDASQFALFCTPVVNLLSARSEKLDIDPDAREYRLKPHAGASGDYQVHSVDFAYGQVDEDSEMVAFQPLDVALPNDERGDERYFVLRRELDEAAGGARRYRTRQTFIRTHTWLTLLGHDREPDDAGIHHLTLDLWLTNGDLPCLLPHDGVNDLIVKDAKPVTSVGFVRAPTSPRPPLALASGARSNVPWTLLRQLHLELAVFDDSYGEPHPGKGLRMMLQPYLGAGDPGMQRYLDSLIAATAKPVYAMHRHMGGLQLERGIEIRLTFDEDRLDGMSPFTFALALERYVTCHVTSHCFTRTVLRTKQRDTVFTWPSRDGTRGAL